jgi:hypothetical protein
MPRDVTVLARTARTAHACATCDWHTSEGEPLAIQPGHRYLIHVAFPGADGYEDGTRPWRMKECVACACEREPTAGLLVAQACATFCCGDVPCALPFEPGAPGHDHSCRRCAIERTEVTTRG